MAYSRRTTRSRRPPPRRRRQARPPPRRRRGDYSRYTYSAAPVSRQAAAAMRRYSRHRFLTT